MSKKQSDPRDNYGPPLSSNNKSIVLGSPSYITKITSSTPSPRLVIRPTLLSPLSFTQKIITSSSSQIKLTSKLAFYTPPLSTKSSFITKNMSEPIIPLEPMYYLSDASFTSYFKNFPSWIFFLPKDLSKIREYYEFILVDTDYISLTHQYDENDKSKLKFSKFKINKVLSPTDWKQHPTESKIVSRAYSPQTYNYLDYTDTWSNFLAIEPFNHIWFNKDISLNFPYWFIQSFELIGPTLDIFPDYASKFFKDFTSVITYPSHKALLSFCAVFGITWITSWTFSSEQLWLNCPASQLIKKFSIKWWIKFNLDLLTTTKLEAWCKAHPSLCKNINMNSEDTAFLMDRSKLLATLSASTSHNEFLVKLKGDMSALSESDSVSNTSDHLNDNEDDCYGVTDL